MAEAEDARQVVLVTGHEGFHLSPEALAKLLALGHANPEALPRDHPDLVGVVLRLGDAAGGSIGPGWGATRLRVATIPADVDWVVEDYDGAEWIVTARRWTEEGPIAPDESQPWRRTTHP